MSRDPGRFGLEPGTPVHEPIVALLGPTNTGKTHRAIERMLEHDSGMIGLPLRLLAREVYDKISARCGESQVALVTGEEKRVPSRPRYWVCTVEAMPVSTPVDFLAVDEIQLAAHPERGHVFTERLLSARGQKETWFMGAETMRELLSELVPTASVRRSPRLSTLRASERKTIGTLLKRSAVVAFSLARVFELAEQLRKKKGGAAVVIGALSPRARNAQVALYQAGEVDFLVATDAIGMGLNLDIDHVMFADLRKFDGRVARELEPAELGQIAGRAGRYVRDGTFGTVAPLPDLSPGLKAAIEDHAFPALQTLRWRSADLDWSSSAALLASLRKKSSARRLRRMEDALDQSVLAALLEDAEVRRLARDEASVKLLWSVCSIPDYRQLLFEEHVALVSRVYRELSASGSLQTAPIEAELERIARSSSDLETLMDRIASIRTWNFVAHQSGWVAGARAIQQRAREIEDALSDALHASLVARFVESSRSSESGKREKQPRPSSPGAAHGGGVPAPAPSSPASPFAKLALLRNRLPARGGEAPVIEDDGEGWIERALDAGHASFDVDALGFIHFSEGGSSRKLGRLTGGRDLLAPEVVVLVEIGGGSKLRLSRRLLAWSRDLVRELIAPFSELEGLGPSGRGIAHLLGRGLGTLLASSARAQLAELSDDERRRFEGAGVVLGRAAVYQAALVKPDMIRRRAALCSAFSGARPRQWPTGAERSVAPAREVPAAIYAAVGYPVVGRRAIRADVLERFAGRVERANELPPPETRLAGWLGSRPAEAAEIMRILCESAAPEAAPPA